MTDLGHEFLQFTRSLYGTNPPLEVEDIDEYRAREIRCNNIDWLHRARTFAELFERDGTGTLEIHAKVGGKLDLDSATTDDIENEEITFRLEKKITNEWCFFLTEAAFANALEDETFCSLPRLIWVASKFERFTTGIWTICPWDDPQKHTSPTDPFELPRKLVRDQTHEMTTRTVDPWLIRGEPPEPSSVFDCWSTAAAKWLAYTLPSEVRTDGTKKWVIFKGPKSTSADIVDTGWYSREAFLALSQAVGWVYGKPSDAEAKFQFLNSHLSLNWPAGRSWPSGVEDVLPLSLASARDSFAFHLQDVAKDALKTLGDLRKGLQEEVAKTQVATRDLVSSLWRDLGIAGVALALKLPTGTQMSQHVLDWIITATAIVLPLSLCITGGTNWRFNRLADAARNEWKPKLYGFVERSEWERIVEQPIRHGRYIYYLTLLFVSLLYITASSFLLSVAAAVTSPLLTWAISLPGHLQSILHVKAVALAVAVLLCIATAWITTRKRKSKQTS
ncbi:hypothetical protein [Paraburkholderia strydomiana]|uniref:hypothetical protein n=1 Tax=Paraburkholderia strydomiana TaxID=1245417 RepID=UPI0038B7C9EB